MKMANSLFSSHHKKKAFTNHLLGLFLIARRIRRADVRAAAFADFRRRLIVVAFSFLIDVNCVAVRAASGGFSGSAC